jgi:hypothetical protein
MSPHDSLIPEAKPDPAWATGILGPKHYVPVLETRLSELRALREIAGRRPATLDRVQPLFEFPHPVPSDYDEARQLGSMFEVVEALEKFWPQRRAFLSAAQVPASDRLKDGRHPLERAISEWPHASTAIVPVLPPEGDSTVESWLLNAPNSMRHGIAIRASRVDATRDDLRAKLDRLLRRLGASASDTDVILDIGEVAGKRLLGSSLTELVRRVSGTGSWRSLVWVAAGFPESTEELDEGRLNKEDRADWRLYRTLKKDLGLGERLPTYGDHCIQAPGERRSGRSGTAPSAYIRFTGETQFAIARTDRRKPPGPQLQQMAAEMIKQGLAGPETFSPGDERLALLARGGRAGRPAERRQWGFSRHIVKVVDQLDSL